MIDILLSVESEKMNNDYSITKIKLNNDILSRIVNYETKNKDIQ